MESLRTSTSSDDEKHLLEDDEQDDGDTRGMRRDKKGIGHYLRSSDVLLKVSMVINLLSLLCFVGIGVALAQTRDPKRNPHQVYSPAQEAVEYKTVVFKGGLHGDKSEYQGSSEDVNNRWEDLYNDIGMSQISANSATKLPNATTPLATDSSQYMVELDVFHQLHCLNLLRKLVYPGVFELDLTSGSDEAEDNIYHMEHCYEQLRQSIQCSSDISTIYWEWSEEKNKMFGNLRTTHTCKDFNKIREWAVEHQLKEEFDWWKEVPGAPVRTDPVSSH